MSLGYSPSRDGGAASLSEEQPRDDTAFLTQSEVSDLLGISVRTVERFRSYGTGPEYSKFGRVVRYRLCDVLVCAERQKRLSTSEGAANALA